MECEVSFESLVNLFDGTLSEAEADIVRRHRDTGCPLCAKRWSWLEGTVPALPGALAQTRPSDRAALERVAQFSRLLSVARKPDFTPYVAELMKPEPGANLVNVVMRGGSASAHHRIYETEKHQITLWDEPDERETRYLIGQVYRRDGEPLEPQNVRLLDNRAAIHTAAREGFEFHLAGIPAGVCILSCEMNTEGIVVPHIQVGVV